MVVNLYVQVPAAPPGSRASSYFAGVVRGVAWTVTGGAAALRVHAALELLLALLSIALVVLAIVARQRAWIIATVMGWAGMTAAGFNGASFLNYGHDFSSLLMALGFLLPVIAYASVLYLTR
jgi:hypothetical protein